MRARNRLGRLEIAAGCSDEPLQATVMGAGDELVSCLARHAEAIRAMVTDCERPSSYSPDEWKRLKTHLPALRAAALANLLGK